MMVFGMTRPLLYQMITSKSPLHTPTKPSMHRALVAIFEVLYDISVLFFLNMWIHDVNTLKLIYEYVDDTYKCMFICIHMWVNVCIIHEVILLAYFCLILIYRIRPNYRPCPHSRPHDFLLYFHLLLPTWRSLSWLFTLFSVIITHLTIFWQ